jgi:hypothetical protein
MDVELVLGFDTVWSKFADVSEEQTAFIFRVED